MPDGLTLAEGVLGVALVVVVVPLLWIVLRRRLLGAGGYAFDCSYNAGTSEEPAWTIGVARLAGESLYWHRLFGLGLSPARVLRRGTLTVIGTRSPAQGERAALYDLDRVVRLHGGSGDQELAMRSASVTTLLAWLEAAPPGGLTYRSDPSVP